MEQEISSGTMLGIVLIALAAVIGLGFGVFSIAKGVANEGTVGVQDNLGSVSDSAYDDYNDKIVTGTMVKSAITNFKGKSCAILVNTTAMNKAVKPYATHEQINVWGANASGSFVTLGILTGAAKDITLSDANEDAFTNSDATVENYYVNYNALLGNCNMELEDGEPTGEVEFSMGNEGCSLVLKDGMVWYWLLVLVLFRIYFGNYFCSYFYGKERKVNG